MSRRELSRYDKLLRARRRGAGFPQAWRSGDRGHPETLKAEAVTLVRERYPDFGPTFAAEKLAELHDIHVSREALRSWMIGAGIWIDRKARQTKVYQPRYRRDCLGELIQIDGCEHWWFEDRVHAPDTGIRLVEVPDSALTVTTSSWFRF